MPKNEVLQAYVCTSLEFCKNVSIFTYKKIFTDEKYSQTQTDRQMQDKTLKEILQKILTYVHNSQTDAGKNVGRVSCHA